MRLYFFVTRDLFILPPLSILYGDGDGGCDCNDSGGVDSIVSNDELFDCGGNIVLRAVFICSVYS
jgi:hypothetical protein